MRIAIIGGGPAGLRAVEVAAAGGASVTLFDAKASVGRKFLVAGRGGLNLTKAEAVEQFAARYGRPAALWRKLIAEMDVEALRAWAAGLGIETFVASTGRVYPREMKAAPLLRRWVERLRGMGVELAMRHRWIGVEAGAPIRLNFACESGVRSVTADAVILALGGGSWPQTGSDGGWVPALERAGVEVAPLAPANCGWECAWTPAVLAAAEGQPLKSIAVSAGETQVAGELLLTRYGLEGGAIYQLGAVLRGMAAPEIAIDFKPAVSAERLIAKLGPVRRNFLAEARARWRLSEAAVAILAERGPFESAAALAAEVKHCRIALLRPRPLAEAISSAGGVRWEELDEGLMLRRLPGVFVAGEMIDWEAPTGGYLIHGCFATGGHAARAALRWAPAAQA